MRRNGFILAAAAAALATAAGPAGAARAASAQWTVVSIPSGGQSGTLLGVSAPTDTDAWAVGSVASGQAGVSNRALIDHWNGAAWQQSTAPALPTGPADTLTAVSASSAADAWAVGYSRFNHYTFTTLALHWDGASWTNVTSVLGFKATIPAGVLDLGPADAYLIANDSSLASGVLERWNGSTWSRVSLPDPDPAHPGLNTAFDSITATSPDDVWVVGTHLQEFSTTLLRYEPYALHWNGSTWSVVAMPTLPGTDNQLAENLSGLVAIGPHDVWAVGGEGDNVIPPGGSPSSTLIEHWDGTSWKVVPSPSLGTASSLTAVAARSAGDVWAVGSYLPAGTTVHQTLTEHWDGTSWTVQPSPTQAGASLFTGASASPGASIVWAVGWSGPSSAPAPRGARNG